MGSGRICPRHLLPRTSDGRARAARAMARRGAPPDAGDAIVPQAVAADPAAIGFTALGHLVPGVRAIAVAREADAPFHEPTYENVARAAYPLSRVFYLVVARKPGERLAAAP